MESIKPGRLRRVTATLSLGGICNYGCRLHAAERHKWVVADIFFQLLKRERIKKKIYGTREEARRDIFDYIEMFYNSRRRHGSSDEMSPNEYEQQYHQRGFVE